MLMLETNVDSGQMKNKTDLNVQFARSDFNKPSNANSTNYFLKLGVVISLFEF